MLVTSKLFQKWHRVNNQVLPETYDFDFLREQLVSPVTILYFFYRSSKRKFDYSNVIESIQDLLVDIGLLSDDNADMLKSIPVGHEVDRQNPRAEIKIFNAGEDYTGYLKGV